MTREMGDVLAVVLPTIIVVSMATSGVLAPVAGQTHHQSAQQGAETGLELTSSGSSAVTAGHNVTANFTLTNRGDQPATAPAVELVNVPGGWELVAQSAGANLSWSPSEQAWVSTRTLAPGDSLTVSATFRLPNETAQSVYHVSARGFDAAGDSATAVEDFPLGTFGDESLSLSATATESVRPGANATVALSLRNTGTNETVAPVIDLTGLPSGWTVVNHTGPANATWSPSNDAWVSTRSLAPGESMNVTVLLGTHRNATVGPYFVAARGVGESGDPAATFVRVNVTGQPLPETTRTTTAAATTTAATTAAAATTTGEAETEAGAETATAEEAETATAEASATFAVEGRENVTVSLEVADEPEERQQGLMFRESLARNHGMVFVYDEADTRTFWMKNTLIPLDMIFVAPNGTVLNVEHARVQPNASDAELDRYASDGEAAYVIELDRGFANRTGVGPGTHVEFDGLNASTAETTAAD